MSATPGDETQEPEGPPTTSGNEVSIQPDNAAEPTHPAAPWRSWGPLEDWTVSGPPMFGRRWPELFQRMSHAETIRVEQFRDGDELVIRAEIPGVDPDSNIEITVAAGKLTLSAHRERREETKDDGGLRSEFHYGSLTRTMSIPSNTSAVDVSASYADGILEVRVPVDTAEESKTKVPISRS